MIEVAEKWHKTSQKLGQKGAKWGVGQTAM
jgi:hypothetical protein